MSKTPKPELIDSENPEWTDTMFAKAKRGTAAAKAKVGRPKLDVTKQSVTLRMDPDVIDYFKQDGRGWQTRLNQVLRDYIAQH